MRRKFSLKFLLIVILGLILAGAAVSYFQPVPNVKPIVLSKDSRPPQDVDLDWPEYGQSALGASGYGVLESNNNQVSVPIASIAKIVTALAVLEKKPLASGEQGPEISMEQADVQLFEDYFVRGGSVVKVENGEKISQYEALQGLLLPSGNNIADSLARWAFGSVEAYADYANKMVKSMGLNQTNVDDASGFSPLTTSTASELVRLGERAMAHPVLAEIVNQKTAVLPVAGEISNVNWALGQDGAIGIKTGNTDEAGGCFLLATKRSIEGQTVTVISAILAAPNRNQAINDSLKLAASADDDFEQAVLIKKGEIVGQYTAPWDVSSQAVAKEDLSALTWKGSEISSQAQLKDMTAGAAAEQQAGAIMVRAGNQQLSRSAVLAKPLPEPSVLWRIFH